MGINRRSLAGLLAIIPGVREASAQEGEGPPHWPCRVNEDGTLELRQLVARCTRRQKQRWSPDLWALECKRLGKANCDGACVHPKDLHRCG